jgi:predicted RNA polymerase sigma factor
MQLRRGNRDAARASFQAALGLARNATERRFLEKRLLSCEAS